MFDLDNTLLAGDSDYAWTQFLISRGCIDKDAFLARNQDFHRDYCNGELEIHDYIAFVAEPMQQLWPDKLAELQADYVEHVRWMMQPAAFDLIARHRERGDYTMIMTATSNLIAGGICDAFGVDSWIATMLEVDAEGITGRINGTPCFQSGKRTLLQSWLRKRPQFSFDNVWFYSDSHNDLPLLEAVGKPVAVDPDAALEERAHKRGWPIVSLRDENITEIPHAETETA